MPMVCCHDALSADSSKIDGNRPHRMGKIGRCPALAKFFAYVISGSIGFQRVAVLAIGLIRKGAVEDSPFSNIRRTDTQREK